MIKGEVMRDVTRFENKKLQFNRTDQTIVLGGMERHTNIIIALAYRPGKERGRAEGQVQQH